jgi:predicted GNAT family acetyltransferase
MRVSWAPAPELATFQAAVNPWLRAEELIHSQLIGVLAAAVAGRYDSCWTLDVRDDADQLQLVALRTPPRPMILSLGSLDAIEALARDLHQRQTRLPGVVGPADAARAFTAAWQALHPGLRAAPRLPLILYRCDALIPPAPVPGAPRVSSAEDALLMIPWGRAFERDTRVQPGPDLEARMSYLCEAGELLIWEVDGLPVACAATVRRSDQTASIGFVYTTPQARKRGFGAAVTAALTHNLLSSGVAYTNLFTDADNPTTNHIYRAIGYTPVCDFIDMAFEV